MTTEHTPGPWFVGAQNDILFIIDRAPRPSNDDVNPNQDSHPIAKVYVPREGTFEAEQANANLIAAAPDLLAALADLLAECELYRGFHPEAGLLRSARQAIAKANGETP